MDAVAEVPLQMQGERDRSQHHRHAEEEEEREATRTSAPVEAQQHREQKHRIVKLLDAKPRSRPASDGIRLGDEHPDDHRHRRDMVDLATNMPV